jgi:phenylalanyl-tRNA synthetase beta chain
LRTSLIPGLIKSARRNFNHDQYRVRLFEIGKVYGRSSSGIPEERRVVGILGTGNLAEEYWRQAPEPYDYYHLKGVVAALMQGIKIPSHGIVPMAGATWQNPGDASLLMAGDKIVGVLGSLGPHLMEQYKLRQPVFLAEIDFEALAPLAFARARYRPLAKYPWVERDLSVVISREIPYGKVEDGIARLGIAELTRIRLIDIYEGVRIPAGRISMTLRFTFQDREKTLTVDRVQGFSDNILTHLRNTYGAELRTL